MFKCGIAKNKYGNNVADLIELCNIIVSSINNNMHPNIWDIAANNLNFSLDILSVNNAVKQIYHIQHLFNWFRGDELFNISYKLRKNCSLCFNSEINNKELGPLLSIDKDDLLSSKSFTEIILKKLSPLNTICATCSYYKDEIIKNDSKYQTCVRQIIESVKIPNFLFFCFELCQGDETDYFSILILKNTKVK